MSPTSFTSHRTTPAWSSPQRSLADDLRMFLDGGAVLVGNIRLSLYSYIIIKPKRNTVLRFNEPQDRMPSIR